MNFRLRKRGILEFVLMSSLIVTAAFGDEHSSPILQQQPAMSGNPLVEEMIKLDSAFHEIVSGVVLGDGERVYRAVESVHGTMERTHEGIHEGTVKLPKNAGRMREFVTMDKYFHAGLEKLAGAAKKNDQQSMLKLTKELLNRCVRCHRMFRTK